MRKDDSYNKKGMSRVWYVVAAVVVIVLAWTLWNGKFFDREVEDLSELGGGIYIAGVKEGQTSYGVYAFDFDTEEFVETERSSSVEEFTSRVFSANNEYAAEVQVNEDFDLSRIAVYFNTRTHEPIFFISMDGFVPEKTALIEWYE